MKRWLRSRRIPNGAAVAITVLGFLGLIVGSLALVGRQLVAGFGELWSEALTGVQQIQDWLADGPLHLTADQIDKYLQEATAALQNNSSSILSGALSFGSTAGHFAAGLVLSLFVLIFFLLEGEPDLGFPCPAAAQESPGRRRRCGPQRLDVDGQLRPHPDVRGLR